MTDLEGKTLRVIEADFDRLLCEDITNGCRTGDYLIIEARGVEIPIAGESGELAVMTLDPKERK